MRVTLSASEEGPFLTFLDPSSWERDLPWDLLLDMSGADLQWLRCGRGCPPLSLPSGARHPLTPDKPAVAEEALPFVAAPDVTAVTVDWLHDSQPCVTTFHYDTGTITAEQIKDLCTTAMNDIETHWLPLLSDNLQLVKVRGRGLWSSSAPEEQVSPAFAAHGTDSSGALANNVSIAVKRGTGLAGRHNRGRLFWPSLSTDQLVAPNQLRAGTGNDIIAACNQLLLAMHGGSPAADEVLVNRTTGAKVAVTAYALVDLFVDSTRRRLPAHNRHH